MLILVTDGKSVCFFTKDLGLLRFPKCLKVLYSTLQQQSSHLEMVPSRTPKESLNNCLKNCFFFLKNCIRIIMVTLWKDDTVVQQVAPLHSSIPGLRIWLTWVFSWLSGIIWPSKNTSVDWVDDAKLPVGMNTCVHGTLWWNGILSRVYSRFTLSFPKIHSGVPKIHSGFTTILTRIKWLLQKNEQIICGKKKTSFCLTTIGFIANLLHFHLLSFDVNQSSQKSEFRK